MKALYTVVVLVVLAAIGYGLYSYFGGAKTAAAGGHGPGGGMQKPPANVVVQTMAEKRVRLWTPFSGRMSAIDYAQVRPEVSGRIVKVDFTDGQYVKAGDELYVIDPRPFDAAVAHAQAAVETAKSKIVYSKSDQARSVTLVAQHALSQSELDQSNNSQRQADAELASAEAQLKQANVDLDHAYIKAPISGRLSRAEVTLGNVVQAGIGAPVLTSIVSQDGIYADFEVDEATYMQTIRNTANGNAQEQKVPVQLAVQGDESHVYNGFIQSFDNRIDPASGTIRARAKFANQDRALVPGMFVSVKLGGSQDRSVLMVPDRAIGYDQDKKFVFVVDAANKVTYREIQLGGQVGSERVVEKGLNAGDRVVVDGTQFVRPDDTVAPTELADVGPSKDEQVAKTTRP